MVPRNIILHSYTNYTCIICTFVLPIQLQHDTRNHATHLEAVGPKQMLLSSSLAVTEAGPVADLFSSTTSPRFCMHTIGGMVCLCQQGISPGESCGLCSVCRFSCLFAVRPERFGASAWDRHGWARSISTGISSQGISVSPWPTIQFEFCVVWSMHENISVTD